MTWQCWFHADIPCSAFWGRQQQRCTFVCCFLMFVNKAILHLRYLLCLCQTLPHLQWLHWIGFVRWTWDTVGQCIGLDDNVAQCCLCWGTWGCWILVGDCSYWNHIVLNYSAKLKSRVVCSLSSISIAFVCVYLRGRFHGSPSPTHGTWWTWNDSSWITTWSILEPFGGMYEKILLGRNVARLGYRKAVDSSGCFMVFLSFSVLASQWYIRCSCPTVNLVNANKYVRVFRQCCKSKAWIPGQCSPKSTLFVGHMARVEAQVGLSAPHKFRKIPPNAKMVWFFTP